MKKRGLVIIILIILIILIPIYFFTKTKKCETNSCFEEAALKCKKATISVEETNKSTSRYEIKGKENNYCLLYIKMEKIAGLSQETKELFENKDMLCKIPIEEFTKMKLTEMGSNLDYCHGLLKEAIYDVVIKKLYKLVIKDMTSVLEEVEKTL